MKIKAFSATFPLPSHQTDGAAGMDLQAVLIGNVLQPLCNSSAVNNIFPKIQPSVEAYNESNTPTVLYMLSKKDEYGNNVKNFIEIPCGWRVRIPTGLYTECPVGMRFEILLRSSLGWKKGLTIPNAPGLIDADYRGQWYVVLYNPNAVAVMIEHGEHIAQLVLSSYERVEWEAVQSASELSGTERGAGGFGSTGK